MPGGRPAKPTSLKVLHGDDRKDPQRINRNEPVPTSGDVVEPPEGMTADARRLWDEMAPDRIRQGVLTAWDVEAFAMFCEAIVLAKKGAVEAHLPAQKGGIGRPPSSMTRFKEAVAICASLGGRFGWTPADRQKLIVGEGRHDNRERLLS